MDRIFKGAKPGVAGPDVGLSLRDLGAHRLKGLPRPERVFQLVIPDLPAWLVQPRVVKRIRRRHW